MNGGVVLSPMDWSKERKNRAAELKMVVETIDVQQMDNGVVAVGTFEACYLRFGVLGFAGDDGSRPATWDSFDFASADS
ncbi:hypothetical protein E2562_032280 [Oryza meyeriana var. granulata]|uniref:Uncharacterized protein n=1 Tax=Oryza meyeriana var. granulata TaxID=110450 RepID=A0A6G1F0P5_9ORYZ|nr:hypothetical protein E2562_032280 [Oryza meyeriana var. granulata]